MRGWATAAVVSAAIVAGCTLGVIDIPATPSPARMSVASQIGPDPADPSRVQVVVSAALDPGIGYLGNPRRLSGDGLGVSGTVHSPLAGGDPDRPTWRVTQSYPSPGPEAIRLNLPRLEDLGSGETINMRIRVDVTAGGTLVLAPGEDLVLQAERPTNPGQSRSWSLELTSDGLPSFRIRRTGDGAWPSEVRVAADDIPPAALPVEATLRVQWDRTVRVFELTPSEAYDLALQSVMIVAWTVESPG